MVTALGRGRAQLAFNREACFEMRTNRLRKSRARLSYSWKLFAQWNIARPERRTASVTSTGFWLIR
jgi:hypothetical protein